MSKLTLAAVAALLLVASPALAEGGGATDRQSGGLSGSQNERMGRGAVNPGAFTFGLRRGPGFDVLFGERGPFGGNLITPAQRPGQHGESAFGNAAGRALSGPSGVNAHQRDKAR